MSSQGADTQDTVLGILGGMGPAATAAFYQRLVNATPAERDSDHVPIVIWADPRIPDRTDAIISGGEDPTPWLRRGAQALRDSGATAVVVPCLTSHHFVRHIAAELDLTLIDMVEHTARHTAQHAQAAVGLLATTGTVAAQLFQNEFTSRGINLIAPDETTQQKVMTAIRLVKAGRVAQAQPCLVDAVETLERAGADVIIMGCTEVPLALEGTELQVPLIDPVQVVIDHIIAQWQLGLMPTGNSGGQTTAPKLNG